VILSLKTAVSNDLLRLSPASPTSYRPDRSLRLSRMAFSPIETREGKITETQEESFASQGLG
jgi:hypothetical protein